METLPQLKAGLQAAIADFESSAKPFHRSVSITSHPRRYITWRAFRTALEDRRIHVYMAHFAYCDPGVVLLRGVR